MKNMVLAIKNTVFSHIIKVAHSLRHFVLSQDSRANMSGVEIGARCIFLQQILFACHISIAEGGVNIALEFICGAKIRGTALDLCFD